MSESTWPHCAMTVDEDLCPQAAMYYVDMRCVGDDEHAWVYPMCDTHDMGNAPCTECGRRLDVFLQRIGE